MTATLANLLYNNHGLRVFCDCKRTNEQCLKIGVFMTVRIIGMFFVLLAFTACALKWQDHSLLSSSDSQMIYSIRGFTWPGESSQSDVEHTALAFGH